MLQQNVICHCPDQEVSSATEGGLEMVLPTAWTEDGRPWKVLMGWRVRKDARLRKDARARQSSASAGTGCLHFVLLARWSKQTRL